MDNPIYEPKKKEVTGDGEDPAAGPVEVDGPASNTYVTFFISCSFHRFCNLVIASNP